MNVLRLALPIVVALPVLAGCGRQPDPSATAPAASGEYHAQVWPLPAAAGSSSPDLSVAPDGHLLLSWMNRQAGRRNALQFASYGVQGGWQSQPRTIAVGQSLAGSWADGPHLRATADGALWAQWLQAGAGGPQARSVVLARSRDGGVTWQQLARVTPGDSQAEHGFASLWPAGADRLGLAWLDGAEPGAAAGEATALRATAYDLDLQRGPVQTVDALACDCCRTDVAMTGRGPLLVWRDRDASDVRDIASARLQGGAWTAPRAVHADGWKVAGCPMNGPAVAARGSDAVVAWYTEAGGTPTLRMARSSDAGDSFGAPVELDRGAAVLGQVDVALDGRQAWVAWLREEGAGQALVLARYAPDLSRELQRIVVARLDGRGHATGAPQLVATDAGAWLAWTNVAGGVAHLQGALVAR